MACTGSVVFILDVLWNVPRWQYPSLRRTSFLPTRTFFATESEAMGLMLYQTDIIPRYVTVARGNVYHKIPRPSVSSSIELCVL